MNQTKKKRLKITIIFLIVLYLIVAFLYIENQNQKLNSEKENENQDLVLYDVKMAQEPESKIEIESQESKSEIEKENPIPFFYLSDFDKYIATCIVAGEAEGEIYEGKLAVAQVILNSMIYGNCSLEEIKWKFDGWNPKLESKNPELWAECKKAVDEVFNDGVTVTDEFILWFYNRDVLYSKFHEEKTKYVMDIGHHSFFTLKD